VQQQGVAPAMKVHCYSVVLAYNPCLAATVSSRLTRVKASCTPELISNVSGFQFTV